MEYSIDIPGYRHIEWFTVGNENEVYLQGKTEKIPKAYGPYTVHNQRKRMLRNSMGNVFMHYAEDLIIPVKR